VPFQLEERARPEARDSRDHAAGCAQTQIRVVQLRRSPGPFDAAAVRRAFDAERAELRGRDGLEAGRADREQVEKRLSHETPASAAAYSGTAGRGPCRRIPSSIAALSEPLPSTSRQAA
jgi:hypothetical protein